MKKTNFDQYLEEQRSDPKFEARFQKAGNAWDIALQIADLRRKMGLSQTEFARRLRTSQQQVSRLESPSYRGHSLPTLRKVARVLGATIQVRFATNTDDKPNLRVSEQPSRSQHKQPIQKLRGALKRKTGTPSLAKEWATHKRKERKLENRSNR